jgi:hypothetical protein
MAARSQQFVPKRRLQKQTGTSKTALDSSPDENDIGSWKQSTIENGAKNKIVSARRLQELRS